MGSAEEIIASRLSSGATLGDIRDEGLEHYGIQGMKWGRRRSEAELASARGDLPSNRAKSGGGGGGSAPKVKKSGSTLIARYGGLKKKHEAKAVAKAAAQLEKAKQTIAKENAATALADAKRASTLAKAEAKAAKNDARTARRTARAEAAAAKADAKAAHDRAKAESAAAKADARAAKDRAKAERDIAKVDKLRSELELKRLKDSTKAAVSDGSLSKRQRKKALKNARSLSNEQLKAYTDRLNGERQMKNLIKEDLSPGRTAAKKIIGDSGKQVAGRVLVASGSALAATLISKKLGGGNIKNNLNSQGVTKLASDTKPLFDQFIKPKK